MNRKNRFPCPEKHYIIREDPIDENGKRIHYSREELEKMYDPTCRDCWYNYRHPSNDPLFQSKTKFKLCRPKNPIGKYFWFKKNYPTFGFWKRLRSAFIYRWHMEYSYWTDWTFFETSYYCLEMQDIKESYYDLSKFTPIDKTDWWKFEWSDEDRAKILHLIKVAYRFQRMWEKELKEKLKCIEGHNHTPCKMGTWGCKVDHSAFKK